MTAVTNMPVLNSSVHWYLATWTWWLNVPLLSRYECAVLQYLPVGSLEREQTFKEGLVPSISAYLGTVQSLSAILSWARLHSAFLTFSELYNFVLHKNNRKAIIINPMVWETSKRGKDIHNGFIVQYFGYVSMVQHTSNYCGNKALGSWLPKVLSHNVKPLAPWGQW